MLYRVCENNKLLTVSFSQLSDVCNPKQGTDKSMIVFYFRSHAGVIRLGNAVIHLLKAFFPLSFDHMEFRRANTNADTSMSSHANDMALFDGPKPVVFDTVNFKELALILRGKKISSQIEFGAHQVKELVME